MSAIGTDLGQAKYVGTNVQELVSYVERGAGVDDTDESVEGTFVIRTAISGKAGELNFIGDEDLIKAFSLANIRNAKENEFTVNIYDAHTGSSKVINEKITGNELIGVIHSNVDVSFDPMADIDVTWNEGLKRFTYAEKFVDLRDVRPPCGQHDGLPDRSTRARTWGSTSGPWGAGRLGFRASC